MSVTVKRCCNSNIKDTGPMISFNAFNVILDGPYKADFDRIFSMYEARRAIERNAPGARETVLSWIIANGIYSYKEMI